MPNRSFLILTLLGVLPSIAVAIQIPAGTALSVRQDGSVSTRHSKVGDAVTAVLISPVLDQDRTVLPPGSQLRGNVTMVRKTGLGFRHQTAAIVLDFRTIRLAGGKELPLDARMKRVDTAREWVDAEGKIHGIGPVTNISSSLAVAAWRLLVVAPGVGASVWATKLMFAPAPDTEIGFSPGTEYRLELASPLVVDDADLPEPRLPARLLGPEIAAETQAIVEGLPSQRAERTSGKSADLVNLVLVGPVEGVTRAFQAAGWSPSDPKAAGSTIHTYFSIVLRRGYQRAPMSNMVLDGNRSDIELEKSLDTFSRRHHLRIWARPQKTQGESVWAVAATEDTGIKFSRQAHNFTHGIDGRVDAERTKVVDDLVYTGCVSEAGLVERSHLPANLENGTGSKLQTDGRVAVLRIDQCDEPRTMPGAGVSERTNVLRTLARSLRNELVRSNFVSLAFNGVRLTSVTRRLFGKPDQDDSGEALTRQQVAWLSGEDPQAATAAPSSRIP